MRYALVFAALESLHGYVLTPTHRPVEAVRFGTISMGDTSWRTTYNGKPKASAPAVSQEMVAEVNAMVGDGELGPRCRRERRALRR